MEPGRDHGGSKPPERIVPSEETQVSPETPTVTAPSTPTPGPEKVEAEIDLRFAADADQQIKAKNIPISRETTADDLLQTLVRRHGWVGDEATRAFLENYIRWAHETIPPAPSHPYLEGARGAAKVNIVDALDKSAEETRESKERAVDPAGSGIGLRDTRSYLERIRDLTRAEPPSAPEVPHSPDERGRVTQAFEDAFSLMRDAPDLSETEQWHVRAMQVAKAKTLDQKQDTFVNTFEDRGGPDEDQPNGKTMELSEGIPVEGLLSFLQRRLRSLPADAPAEQRQQLHDLSDMLEQHSGLFAELHSDADPRILLNRTRQEANFIFAEDVNRGDRDLRLQDWLAAEQRLHERRELVLPAESLPGTGEDAAAITPPQIQEDQPTKKVLDQESWVNTLPRVQRGRTAETGVPMPTATPTPPTGEETPPQGEPATTESVEVSVPPPEPTPTLKPAQPAEGQTTVEATVPAPEQTEAGGTPERSLPALRMHGASVESERHPGRNEDTIGYSEEDRYAMVFDGVGGYDYGREASQLASSVVSERLRAISIHEDLEVAEDKIRTALLEASYGVAENYPPGSGTTATVVKLIEHRGEHHAIIGHVGDSRAYRIREGKIHLLTEDDSGVWDRVRRGEGTRDQAWQEDTKLDELETPEDFNLLPDVLKGHFQSRNVITQSLGGESFDVHMYRAPLAPGDRLLLTTDGVHDNLTRSEIENALRSGAADPAQFLVQQAQQRSRDGQHIRAKPDDMSAVVVDIIKTAPTEPTPPPEPTPTLKPTQPAGGETTVETTVPTPEPEPKPEPIPKKPRRLSFTRMFGPEENLSPKNKETLREFRQRVTRDADALRVEDLQDKEGWVRRVYLRGMSDVDIELEHRAHRYTNLFSSIVATTDPQAPSGLDVRLRAHELDAEGRGVTTFELRRSDGKQLPDWLGPEEKELSPTEPAPSKPKEKTPPPTDDVVETVVGSGTTGPTNQTGDQEGRSNPEGEAIDVKARVVGDRRLREKIVQSLRTGFSNWVHNLDPRGKDKAWFFGAAFGAFESAAVLWWLPLPGAGWARAGLNLALMQGVYGITKGGYAIAAHRVRQRYTGEELVQRLADLEHGNALAAGYVRNFFLGTAAMGTWFSAGGGVIEVASEFGWNIPLAMPDVREVVGSVRQAAHSSLQSGFKEAADKIQAEVQEEVNARGAVPALQPPVEPVLQEVSPAVESAAAVPPSPAEATAEPIDRTEVQASPSQEEFIPGITDRPDVSIEPASPVAPVPVEAAGVTEAAAAPSIETLLSQLPADAVKVVDIPAGSTVSEILVQNGYPVTWTPADAEMWVMHLAIDLPTFHAFWDEMVAAGNETGEFPIKDLRMLKKIFAEAKSADPEIAGAAQKKLIDGLHWISAGGKLKVLTPKGYALVKQMLAS